MEGDGGSNGGRLCPFSTAAARVCFASVGEALMESRSGRDDASTGFSSNVLILSGELRLGRSDGFSDEGSEASTCMESALVRVASSVTTKGDLD